VGALHDLLWFSCILICTWLDEDKDGPGDPKWLPLPLRLWFWLPFVVILALGAIALEVALHFSNKNQGELVLRRFLPFG
jgi:hypothetical protein